MDKLLGKFISKIKNEEYVINDDIKSFDVFSILLCKFIQIIRGMVLGLLFKEKKGFVFVGKHVSVKHPWKISCGKNLILNDNIFINGLSKRNIEFGNNVSIGRNTIIDCTGVISNLGENLIIGNNVGISPYCFFGIRGSVMIGDNTIIGPYVSLHAENHIFTDTNELIRSQGTTRKGINIGSNCWIGAKATILDGINIGNGVVIAAGSVVTKDVPNNAVIAGVPAKVMRFR